MLLSNLKLECKQIRLFSQWDLKSLEYVYIYKALRTRLRDFIISIFIRRDKLNSQFIVTKFSICMRAGGHYSDFKPVKRARKAMLELEIGEAPPSN